MAFATTNASPPRTCRMRNAPPWKGNPQPHAKCPSWKGNPQPHAKFSSWKGNPQPHAKCPPGKGKPHAKCSLPERDSLPIDFMLE